MIHFDPEAMPAPRTCVHLDKRPSQGEPHERLQSYTLLSTRGTVMRWLSRCSECGERFEFKTGATIRGMYRRCKPCRELRPWEPAGRVWRKAGETRNRWTIEPYVDPASLF